MLWKAPLCWQHSFKSKEMERQGSYGTNYLSLLVTPLRYLIVPFFSHGIGKQCILNQMRHSTTQTLLMQTSKLFLFLPSIFILFPRQHFLSSHTCFMLHPYAPSPYAIHTRHSQCNRENISCKASFWREKGCDVKWGSHFFCSLLSTRVKKNSSIYQIHLLNACLFNCSLDWVCVQSKIWSVCS